MVPGEGAFHFLGSAAQARNLNLSLNPNLMNTLFDHEKPEICGNSWHLSPGWSWLIQALPKTMAVRDQLDRASTSITLNLAEGNGKYTRPDRCRFFDISRGSALECAAALDVLVAKGRCELAVVSAGKEHLRRIVSMLVGLIRANSDYRMHEGD